MASDDLTEFSDTHTHEMRTSPLVKGLAAVVAVLAAAVVILGWHVTHRQALADTRQAANTAAQRRLNGQFEATRDAQCYLIAYSASHVERPHRSVIREALANAAVRAGCPGIVYAATHPATPQAAATPVTVPGPTTTVTVTRTAKPPVTRKPGKHHQPTPKPTPLCTIGPVTGRLPCPPTIRPSLAPNLH